VLLEYLNKLGNDLEKVLTSSTGINAELQSALKSLLHDQVEIKKIIIFSKTSGYSTFFVDR